jgi:hypothetical protein
MPGEMNKPGWDALPCLLFVVGPAILIYYVALLMFQSGLLLASTRLNDAVTLLALVFANLSLISGAYPSWNALSSRKLRATMADLHQSGEEVVLYYGPLEAAGIRLQDYGIPHRRVERRDELPCPRPLELRVFCLILECPPTP